MKKKLSSLLVLLLVLSALFSACSVSPAEAVPEVPETILTEATETAPPETQPAAEPSALPTEEALPADPSAILDAAFALGQGEALEGEYTLTGTITQIIDRYSEKYGNITVKMVIPGQEHRPIQCFRLTGNDCQHIAVGDTITVTGQLKNYKGTIEFDEDCYLEYVEWGTRPQPTTQPADQDRTYSASDDSKEAVAAYIHANGCLPDFYMTKNEAEEAYGWEGGPLDKLAPGMAIGGDRFTNYQKILPTAPGRTYTECDIDTIGANARGAKRIVFSNDGLIYYTDDHYDSFELLYGEP